MVPSGPMAGAESLMLLNGTDQSLVSRSAAGAAAPASSHARPMLKRANHIVVLMYAPSA